MSQQRLSRDSGAHTVRAHHVYTYPRDNEIRVLERDGRRWLQQWRTPPGGQIHERAWVEVGELAWPRSIRQRVDTPLVSF